MRHAPLYFVVTALSLSIYSFQHSKNNGLLTNFNVNTHGFLNSGGSPGGRTGAPGESTCTSCHGGQVQSGVGFNTIVVSNGNGPVSNYIPGETYTVVVTMATNNPKNGFEIVALGSANQAAGSVTITDATNTKKITIGGKQRATHTSSGNTMSTWTYSWTAPATDMGMITFYLATNQTNSNGQDTGDIIRTSQLSLASTLSINDNKNISEAQISYNTATNSVHVELSAIKNGDVSFNLVDLNGKTVQFERLGKVEEGNNTFNVRVDHSIPNGYYIVHLGLGNQFTSKKIVVINE